MAGVLISWPIFFINFYLNPYKVSALFEFFEHPFFDLIWIDPVRIKKENPKTTDGDNSFSSAKILQIEFCRVPLS